jgi:Tfp pilus assembly protein PilF
MADISRKPTRVQRLFLESWHPYAWITAVGLALYFRAVFFGWSYWDDDHLVLLNYERISHLRNIGLAFRTDVNWQAPGYYYRPGLTLSLMADALWGGIKPWAYHAGNLIQHVIASCLVLAFFRKLGGRTRTAFVSAMLFAVHPVNAQAVAWIPGRNDLLLAAFAIQSFLFFVRYLDQGGLKWLGGSLAFYALAVFTKEAGLLLPLVFFWYLVLFQREKLASMSLVLLVAGWIAVAAGFLLTRSMVVYSGVARFTQAGDNLTGLVNYIGKILIPVNLSVLPVPQDMKMLPGMAALFILVLFFLWGKVADKRRFLFGLGWFLVFLLPLLLRGAGFPNYLEHRMYLPLPGLLLMVQESGVFHRRPVSKIVGIAVPATILAFAAINLQHQEAFKDDISFWQNAVRTSPHAYFGHTVLAQRLGARGLWEHAENEFKISLSLNPSDPLVENDLGQVLAAQNKWPEAEQAFLRALEGMPGDAGLLKNLGQVSMRKGDWVQAESRYREILGPNPDDPEVLDRLALACYMQGKYREAAGFYEQAIGAGVEPDPRIIKMLQSHNISGRK